MKAKTPAERKADERQRRKESGQVLVQEWVHHSVAEKLKNYAAKLRKEYARATA
jgi:hypothetical protein